MFRKNKKDKDESEERLSIITNPMLRGLTSIGITIVSMTIILAVIWNAFTYILPRGSWINIVDGTSMDPTLQDGQLVFTDVTEISRGDIVTAYVPRTTVEQYPEMEGKLLIKRVIGIPGDKIEITMDGIYVNDVLLEENYLTDSAKTYTYKESKQHQFELVSNEYFIVGDNREVSYDSRSFGPVSTTEMLYKQSETPTLHFWWQLMKLGGVLILSVFLYMGVEFVLTEGTYKAISKFQKRENPHL